MSHNLTGEQTEGGESKRRSEGPRREPEQGWPQAHLRWKGKVRTVKRDTNTASVTSN